LKNQLQMEDGTSSKTLVTTYQTMQCHNPKEQNLNSQIIIYKFLCTLNFLSTFAKGKKLYLLNKHAHKLTCLVLFILCFL
jgi:hypothetical protein